MRIAVAEPAGKKDRQRRKLLRAQTARRKTVLHDGAQLFLAQAERIRPLPPAAQPGNRADRTLPALRKGKQKSKTSPPLPQSTGFFHGAERIDTSPRFPGKPAF